MTRSRARGRWSSKSRGSRVGGRPDGTLGRLLVLLSAAVLACSPPPLDDLELVAGIEEFERAIEGRPRAVVQKLLRDHAWSFRHRLVRVEGAVVASPYTRERPSRIYFGYNYEPADHLFLSELDPPLHQALEHHRHWLSAVKTYRSRQLSYELPVDQATFARAVPGEEVTFTCTVAALIRRTSVYCVPVEMLFGPEIGTGRAEELR